MKQITKIRKAVCVIANELKRAGYSLSQAFKEAWNRVRQTMTVKAVGTTFENRQERLQFLKQFRLEDLTITLEREKDNKFDPNAIQIVAHIIPINRRTVIGYISKEIAKVMSKMIDKGIQMKAVLRKIIGGCGWKESLGVLVEIGI